MILFFIKSFLHFVCKFEEECVEKGAEGQKTSNRAFENLRVKSATKEFILTMTK